ncbi:MAG: prepilin-type N-terminal cleavage/methylation domain-containing protein [Mariprofundaceae bacterium]
MKRIQRGLNRGFTLLELMVALSVFALIASVCYAALVPAGEGFRMLQKQRDLLESSYQLDRRLRMDVSYMLRSQDKTLLRLEITHDQRGEDAFDQLSLLTSDQASLAPLLVHYALDEETGHLVRTSQAAWMRETEPVNWKMQQAVSFEVKVLDDSGDWRYVWDKKNGEKMPQALRVRWRAEGGLARELILPLILDGSG